MKRENRYYVVKIKDVDQYLSIDDAHEFKYLLGHIGDLKIQITGKESTHYACIGHDWPMYEDTWEAVEAWVDGLDQHPHYHIQQALKYLRRAAELAETPGQDQMLASMCKTLNGLSMLMESVAESKKEYDIAVEERDNCPAIDAHCDFYAYKADGNGDVDITHCRHPDNPDKFEGNCRHSVCPIAVEEIGMEEPFKVDDEVEFKSYSPDHSEWLTGKVHKVNKDFLVNPDGTTTTLYQIKHEHPGYCSLIHRSEGEMRRPK